MANHNKPQAVEQQQPVPQAEPAKIPDESNSIGVAAEASEGSAPAPEDRPDYYDARDRHPLESPEVAAALLVRVAELEKRLAALELDCKNFRR